MSENKLLDEILWSQIFNQTIRGSEWLDAAVPFSPGRSAVGYPCLYALYRILNEFKPVSILEIGLGQSTKLIGKYTGFYQKQRAISHTVVEHDPDWIAFFKNSMQEIGDVDIKRLPIEKIVTCIPDYGNEIYYQYTGFADALKGKKFDLILIDGPFGGGKAARVDILNILPDCLADHFILLIDDYQREGEQFTAGLVRHTLERNHIPYFSGCYKGEDDVCIITSVKEKYFCTL